MIGDAVRLIGFTVRYTEAAVSPTARTLCRGRRAPWQRCGRRARVTPHAVRPSIASYRTECRTPSSALGASGGRLGRERPQVLRLLGEVEQHHRDLHAADAVGERVVQLAHQRRPTVGQPVDEGHLPQRPGMVELAHLRTPGHLEHGVERPGVGRD